MRLLRSIAAWFAGPSPHTSQVEEAARVSSPDQRRDAVLVMAGGGNVRLYVVPVRKAVQGHETLAAFIHCDMDRLEVSWPDEAHVLVTGEFAEVALHGRAQVVENRQGACRLEVGSRSY